MNQSKILKHFTKHAHNILEQSIFIASSLKLKEVNLYIFLYSLSLEPGSLATEILNRSKLNQKELEKFLLLMIYQRENKERKKVEANTINFNDDVQKIIIKAFTLSLNNNDNHIGTEHLLMSIINLHENEIRTKYKLPIDLTEKISKQLAVIFESNNKFPSILNHLQENPNTNLNQMFDNNNPDMQGNELEEEVQKTTTAKESILDHFCLNLTDESNQINIDPVIGRKKEIERITQILSRRNKNNPVLLGDPGVGKTAIVEGLAKNILEGKVPNALLNKKVYALDLTSLLSGTMYRGEFEGRMKKIIDELKNRPDIILFIDELHNIIGAGSSTGSMDAANILKPALARGQIRCIGATTYEEYKKFIEKDAALDRRFQTIDIKEASTEEAVEIIKGIKKHYESYHHVKINEKAIVSAVQLSNKYLTNQSLPDKAIDLIDEAAARLKVKENTNPLIKKLAKLEKSLSSLENEKYTAINSEKYTEAISLQTKENSLLKKLEENKTLFDKEKNNIIGEIQVNDIIDVLAQQLNVSAEEISLSDKKILLKLEEKLNKTIIGQETGIKMISDAIIKAKAGIHNDERPLASFIFIGPSGTGKTELAKQIAKYLFTNEKALIRVDMTEFSESFNMSKLIGAPAGYVGFREENKLTDLVKKNPYSVILFDEIEKAHPQIFNLLLPVLDEGYLTDATGKKINFRNSIIIFTSNLGSRDANKKFGFNVNPENNNNEENLNYQQSLKNFFAPEFINRLDQTVVFKSLNKINLEKIAKQKLNNLKDRLKKKNILLSFSPKVKDIIVEAASKTEQEARGLEQVIKNKIENQLAQFIMKNQKIELNGNQYKIQINYQKDRFTFKLK